MNNNTIKMIEEQIGYKFKSPDLLRQAFIRSSYANETGCQSNEVLEFIGDKVLDFVVVKILTEKYGTFKTISGRGQPYEFISEYSEGKLTEIKQKLVSRNMLSERIRIFGFQHLIVAGHSDNIKNISENESVQEDLFEAILGAVALDSEWNMTVLTNVVEFMLDPHFYLDKDDSSLNYTQLIQQWFQKRFRIMPIYRFPSITSQHLRPFIQKNGTVQCTLYLKVNRVDYPISFEALGHTKAEARMNAAKKGYEYLAENNLLLNLIDEVGKPDFDRAVNQLQELYQKKYIGEPTYKFSESHDDNGNPIWRCECYVAGESRYYYGDHSSKKYGKKSVAYDMLCYILDWEDADET